MFLAEFITPTMVGGLSHAKMHLCEEEASVSMIRCLTAVLRDTATDPLRDSEVVVGETASQRVMPLKVCWSGTFVCVAEHHRGFTIQPVHSLKSAGPGTYISTHGELQSQLTNCPEQQCACFSRSRGPYCLCECSSG